MKKIKLAYFGTPDFSAYFLEKLINDKELPIEVVSVVTQEDKPVGRKQILTSTPVKKIAEKYRIPIASLLHGSTVNNETMKQWSNGDLALLYAYGELISQDILNIPTYGFWNVHPSLLPKYRGPSPVASALIAGEKETGVTLIKLIEELDAGPIIAQKKVKIEPKERTPELSMRLAEEGYKLLRDVILTLSLSKKKNLSRMRGSSDKLRDPSVVSLLQDDKLTSQDHKKVTYTKRFAKQDGFIEISNLKFQISNSPEKLFNLFRGLYPWPGIWSKLRIKNRELRIKVTDMDLVEGKIIIKKVQLEGKNEVDFEVFNNAYNIF